MDKEVKQKKLQLGKLIDYLGVMFPNQSQVSDDLWRFAKGHDRRSYNLIRFCMAEDSDYRKIQRSIVRCRRSVIQTVNIVLIT